MKAGPCDAHHCSASLRNGEPCRYRAKSHHPDHGPLCGVHLRSALNAKECSICLEPVRRRQGLPCGHCFHARCIAAWFRRGPLTCPLCRAPASGASAPLSVRVTAYFQYRLPRVTARTLALYLPYLINSVEFVQEVGVTACELSLLRWTAYETRTLPEFVQLLKRYEAFGEPAA